MIGIVDYGMGNLRSVFSAFDYLGADVMICTRPEQLTNIDKIVLPGVGSFKDCIGRLKQVGFVDQLNEAVLRDKKPVLGICLGMQVMATHSYEGGVYEGLGWIDAEVIKLHPENKAVKKVPNIGWEMISYKSSSELFKGLSVSPDVYFVHSYYMKCKDESVVAASYEYDHTVTAAIQKRNIFATQFHPEKSQDVGLKILENFISWNP